jgi:hypothetical protein
MTGRGLAALRQYARRPVPEERCNFCALPLEGGHQHLIDPTARTLICACDACAVLFTSTGETKFRRIPRLVRELPDFQLSEWQWSAFGIPIAMVFFFFSTPAQKVIALYPSPAGPAESPLDLREWEDLVEANPGLRKMLPDVEALLVNRVAGARDYFLAPIDRCYELTGLIRRHWSGFSGGVEAWNEIGRFFEGLRREAAPFSAREHA